MYSWWRTGVSGRWIRRRPLRSGFRRRSSTTTGERISPRLVAIPFTRPFARSNVVTCVLGSIFASSSAARAAKLDGDLGGDRAIDRWHVAEREGSAGSKWGRPGLASAAKDLPRLDAEPVRDGEIGASRLRQASAGRRGQAAGIGGSRRWPSSDSKRSNASQASCRSAAMTGVEAVLLVSAAARADVCEPIACWSTSITFAPRWRGVRGAGAERASANYDRCRRLHGKS